VLPGLLVSGVLGSLMGGRRKRSKRAYKHLKHGFGGLPGMGISTILNHPTAALTAAGVAWGIFETMQNKGGGSGSGQGFGGQSNQWGDLGGTPVGANAGGFTTAGPNTGLTPQNVGPQHGTQPPATSVPLPPLPNIGGSAASAPDVSGSGAGAPADVLRMLRLACSAARADGAMNEQERAAVIEHAKAAGVSELVEQELSGARPLAEIVLGVSDPAERATLYVLAYTILRADEQVTGAERIYLAQLASLLSLDPPTVQKLEADTNQRIDTLSDQDQ
jgi:tellurite resistance protein